jgi:hypothetical protein
LLRTGMAKGDRCSGGIRRIAVVNRKNDRRVILVTGSPRSGTTGIGTHLALSSTSSYLHEPLNFHSGVKPVACYFEMPGIEDAEQHRIQRLVDDIRSLRLRFKSGLFPDEPLVRKTLKAVTGARPLNSYRLCKLKWRIDNLVWKDPLAIFLSEYCIRNYGMHVVLTFRPAAAVAASFKRMEWAFDLQDIVRRLSEAGIGEYQDVLDAYSSRSDEYAVNGALLWYFIYSVSIRWSGKYPDKMITVDAQSIINQPLQEYERLYRRLGLPWTQQVQSRLEKSYRPRTPLQAVPDGKRAHTRNRDLAKSNNYWKSVLNSDEKSMVKELEGLLEQERPCGQMTVV